MANEPPSLAARLEHDGPLPWREAARLAARIARALDRLHAQGKSHGGLEPLTVLFVGGTVRLADPLPEAARDPAFLAPSIRAGEPPDRQTDFHALGQLMAAMHAGKPHAPVDHPDLPPPLAAVQRRLVDASAAAGYGSGNDVAAALELAIAASEGFAAATPPASPPPLEPLPRATERMGAATAVPIATGLAGKRQGARPRRRRPALVGGLIACLALGGVAVLWLWPTEEVAVVAPRVTDVVLPEPERLRAPEAATGDTPPATPEVTAPIPLDEVLAALPEVPLGPPPAKPEARAQVEALLAELATWPCSRLEVEPTPLGLRLVGSTSTATHRTSLLGAIASLDDVDRVTVELNSEGAHCRLYDLLASRAAVAMPRLADLFPSRDDYRLAAAEPLVIRVLTPDFPAHLMVDYFTADGMVVHLVKHEAEPDPVQPRTELRIGDPADGHWLTIAEPFGQELILVIASMRPLFAEARPQIEPADAYLEVLEVALGEQPEPPIASTMAIETIPAAP